MTIEKEKLEKRRHRTVIILLVAVMLCALIPAVVILTRVGDTQIVETADEITVTFSESGFSQDVGDLRINGYAKGLQARVTYLIVNETGEIIIPSIDRVFTVRPDDYSQIEGRGYVAAPSYYSDWVDVPSMGEIAPGESARYTIKLKIPGNAKENVPKRWAFQTWAASNTGGFMQVAPGLWWLVEMR